MRYVLFVNVISYKVKANLLVIKYYFNMVHYVYILYFNYFLGLKLLSYFLYETRVINF